MKLKNVIGIVVVVGVSSVLGVSIWSMPLKRSLSDHHAHEHGASMQPDRDEEANKHADRHRGGETHEGQAHASLRHTGHDHEAEKHISHDHKGEMHSEHEHGHGDGERGPHGGRLLEDGDFEVEVVTFETGVPPQFRIYCAENHKPIDPKEVKASLTLHRLGGRATEFEFYPFGQYLKSDTIVQEPHSFEVTVRVEHGGTKYRWEYDQVEGRIHLGSDVARRVGIHALPATRQRIRSVLELPGEIALNADRVCHIVPRISGVVAEARKNLGDRVDDGEVVAVIDSRELANAKSEYLVHLKREELARINYERIEKLWEKKVSPEKEFLDAQKELEEQKIETLAAVQKLRALGLSPSELDALRENPNGPMTRYEIQAPFDGIVISKHMAKGEGVRENSDILCVADLSNVWVNITVYAKDIDSIRIGQKVTVTSNSSELTASGEISYVGPLMGEETRTARARVVLDNTHSRWRPGMFVTVKIVRGDEEVPLAVREDAVQSMDRFGSVVFVQYGEQYEVRPVQLGRSDGTNVEIRKGLLPGEMYVAAKSFILKSELSTAGLSHSH